MPNYILYQLAPPHTACVQYKNNARFERSQVWTKRPCVNNICSKYFIDCRDELLPLSHPLFLCVTVGLNTRLYSILLSLLFLLFVIIITVQCFNYLAILGTKQVIKLINHWSEFITDTPNTMVWCGYTL